MPPGDDNVRWTVLFSGSVQGVGFRYTTERVARQYAVTGYVRNLADGRVEVVAEGSPAEVRRFLDAIEQTMGGYIGDRRRTEAPAGGRFTGFAIRF